MRMMAFLCWFGLSTSVCLFAWGVVGVYGCGLLVSIGGNHVDWVSNCRLCLGVRWSRSQMVEVTAVQLVSHR
jgi:hypothetical protein